MRGEGKSTATLELQDGQIELASKIASLGVDTVAVLVNSKPLVLPESVLGAQAIFECFNPGMMGGRALAEALVGKLNPSGKLTVSVPRHVGQQPVYYNQVRGQHGTRYADLTQEPAFPFGFGLSYSRFEYGAPRLSAEKYALGDTVSVSFDLRNGSDRDGVEIAQLYIEDEVTSLTWALRELVAFERVELKAGQARRITLEVPVSELWIAGADGRKIVERGYFRALVGGSSRLADLQAARFFVE